MRSRSVLLFVGVGVALAASVRAFVACGGEEEESPTNGAADSASVDVLLIGDVKPPEPDAEPPAGDVCGNKQGLDTAAPWPLRGGCPTRAGWSIYQGPQISGVRWVTPLRAGETSAAIPGAGGVVWVGTLDGDIVAVTETGLARWAHHTGGEVKSSPAIDTTGNAIAGSMDGNLYSVDVGDGPLTPSDAGVDGGGDPDASAAAVPPAHLVWKLPVGKIASSPVIGADGTIYVGTIEGKLVAVAGNGSTSKWNATTNDTNGTSPALGQDGTIYVGSTDHKLYAINSADGSIKWSSDVGAEIKGSPAVGGEGTIYIGSIDGKLHALEKADGKERWSYSAGGPIKGTPAVYAGAVYVGSDDKKLHAVSTQSGAKRWTYDTLGAVGSPVIGPDGVVYVGSEDGHLYAVTSKGSLFFASNIRGAAKSQAAISNTSLLYVTTDTSIVSIGQ